MAGKEFLGNPQPESSEPRAEKPEAEALAKGGTIAADLIPMAEITEYRGYAIISYWRGAELCTGRTVAPCPLKPGQGYTLQQIKNAEETNAN
jgi:hypothetical protein